MRGDLADTRMRVTTIRRTPAISGALLLVTFAVTLIVLGIAYLVLAATSALLPGDLNYLGMSKAELCEVADCDIVGFITHNRAAYGGVMVASGLLSAWTAWIPLRAGEPWAWWSLGIAGMVLCGCSAAFIVYGQSLAYGFEAWHVGAIAIAGIAWSVGIFITRPPRGERNPVGAFRSPGAAFSHRCREGHGRLLMVFLGAGFVASGVSVLGVALTTVFVPEDISFLGPETERLADANHRLLPLIAHDRAEFGIGMMTIGFLMTAAAWKGLGVHGPMLLFILGGADAVHFTAVIVSHFGVGYTDFVHLAPVYGAAMVLAAGTFASVTGQVKRPQSAAAQPLVWAPGAGKAVT